MDPSGIIGTVLALAAVLGLMAFEGTHLSAILLPGPIVIVLFGTLGAGLAGSTIKDVLWAFKCLPGTILARPARAGANIDTIVSLADKARREGLLALEEDMRSIDDEFLKRGLSAAIDGTDAEDLRELLENFIDSKREEAKTAFGFFKELGGYAPTIGIIGTVVSLVHVLENLSDVAALGPMIAGAFVATLWGVLTANMIWLPLSNRMKRISALECAQMEVTLEGLMALQSGANPRMVGERLRSLIPAKDVTGEAA